MRRFRSKTVMLLLTALLVPSFMPADSAGSQVTMDPSAEYLRNAPEPVSEVAQIQRDWDLSLDEATRRIERQTSISDLNAVAAEMPDYSGMWIDHADGGKVVIAFTTIDPVKNAALRSLFAADSGLLEFREVQWSDRELQALYDQLSDSKAALRARGLPVASVSISESVNAIVLQVTQDFTSAQWAELNRRFPGAPLRTELVVGSPIVEAL